VRRYLEKGRDREEGVVPVGEEILSSYAARHAHVSTSNTTPLI
jgi:hypothetical protein